MTQRARVLQMLQNAGSEGVSSKTFIASYMPRAAARVKELREEGYQIVSEREGKYTRYTLESSAGNGVDPQREPGVHGLGNPTVGAASGRGSTGGRGQTSDSRPRSANAASGAPTRSVPSMFDADECLDWGDAA